MLKMTINVALIMLTLIISSQAFSTTAIANSSHKLLDLNGNLFSANIFTHLHNYLDNYKQRHENLFYNDAMAKLLPFHTPTQTQKQKITVEVAKLLNTKLH